MVAAPPINAFKPVFRKGRAIVLTRRMQVARRSIRRQRPSTERAGLVASAAAQRLSPQAIAVRGNIDPVHWFLSAAKDTRSLLSLSQSVHSFRGAKRTDVKKPERRRYLKNAYRVLLKRVRRGKVIFVPPGVKPDRTHSPGSMRG